MREQPTQILTSDEVLAQTDYITSSQAARLSGLSMPRISRLTGTGELPSVRVGTWRLIPRVAFEAWLAGREKR